MALAAPKRNSWIHRIAHTTGTGTHTIGTIGITAMIIVIGDMSVTTPTGS
jgi:hypothetical protein